MSTHLRLVAAVLIVPLLAQAAAAQDGKKQRELKLQSELLMPRIQIGEHAGISEIQLRASVDAKGEGQGVLVLNPNSRGYNEFGDVTTTTERATIDLPCTIKFMKAGKANLGPPRFEQLGRRLYEIEAKKVSRISLVVYDQELRAARLVIYDKEGAVSAVVTMHHLGPPEPCHPGCFPAGTLVHTPEGSRAIEKIRAGDKVTSVTADGVASAIKVQSVFTTPNRLLSVQTDGGTLMTTLTQPLCLADGGCRAAGELKPGDRIVRWQDGKRQVVTVTDVTLTDRYEVVFNLILGDSEVFIAGGFLARSKPPSAIVSAESAPPSALPSRRE